MSNDDNRRIADRHAVCLGAEIETEAGRVRSAITRDASATGLLLLTRSTLSPGAAVRVRIFLPGNDPPHLATGRVVRSEPLSAEERGLWSQKVAIAFDQPVLEVDQALAELAERQEQLHGKHGR